MSSNWGNSVYIETPIVHTIHNGEVAERLKAAVLKTVVGFGLPRVRISPSPPELKNDHRVIF